MGKADNELRLKFEINLKKGIPPGFFLGQDELSPLWVQCRYCNLGKFCFKCGRIGHNESQCDKEKYLWVHSDQSHVVQMYGQWMHSENRIKAPLEKLSHLVGKLNKGGARGRALLEDAAEIRSEIARKLKSMALAGSVEEENRFGK